MITSKAEYKKFLMLDAAAMGIDASSKKNLIYSYITNPRWRFIKALRRAEFYHSQKSNISHRILFYLFWYKYKRLGFKLGFTIPLNVCGPGLSLPHYGTLVISKDARIGSNARIHICVNIGASNGGAPIIGDNVYIGPGAKIFGPILIGNNVQIGANAVVNRSFEEDSVVIAGVPAKVVKRIELKK